MTITSPDCVMGDDVDELLWIPRPRFETYTYNRGQIGRRLVSDRGGTGRLPQSLPVAFQPWISDAAGHVAADASQLPGYGLGCQAFRMFVSIQLARRDAFFSLPLERRRNGDLLLQTPPSNEFESPWIPTPTWDVETALIEHQSEK